MLESHALCFGLVLTQRLLLHDRYCLKQQQQQQLLCTNRIHDVLIRTLNSQMFLHTLYTHTHIIPGHTNTRSPNLYTEEMKKNANRSNDDEHACDWVWVCLCAKNHHPHSHRARTSESNEWVQRAIFYSHNRARRSIGAMYIVVCICTQTVRYTEL